MVAMDVRGPIQAFFDLFNSIKLGIVLIVLIILYSAVGSAIPNARQYFELTEFEYFNHWIFATLIGLFCLTLTVVTVRRIPLSWRNAGVLTVHAGLLTLCAGSLVYFGRKVEGDVLLMAPRIQVLSESRFQAGQSPVIDEFAVFEGKVWDRDMPMIGGRYRIEVLRVEHKDLVTAAQVNLSVAVGDKPAELVELSQGEATRSFAKISDKIYLKIDPANVSNVFYDNQTSMLVVDRDGRKGRCEIPQLPYYQERFVDGIETIRDIGGQEVRCGRSKPLPLLEKWEMPFRADDPTIENLFDSKMRFDIDGYLPYAELETTYEPGGASVQPVARIRLSENNAQRTVWLNSGVPAGSSTELQSGTSAELRWIGDAAAIHSTWTRPLRGNHVLEVQVEDKNVSHQFNIEEGSRLEVPGTPYRLTVERLDANWPLMTSGFQGARTPTALVWVDTGEKQFQRSVLQRFPELNQDRDRGGKKLRDDGGLVDDNIVIRYWDASADRFMIFAGSNLAPTLVHTRRGGARTVQLLRQNDTYSADSGPGLCMEELIERPIEETSPVVIPNERRQPLSKVQRAKSLVRVRASKADGTWSKRVWVPSSHFEDPTHPSVPTAIEIPEIGIVGISYTRPPRDLGGRIVLERLHTEFYPGRRQPSEWTSYVRLEDPESGQVYRTRVFLNNTRKMGAWTLFQSTAANDHETYTGLGVGNRKGVFTMLMGCVMISLGMSYAFAVKPIIVRRRVRKLEMASRDPAEHDDNGNGHEQRASKGGRLKSVSRVSAVLLTVLLSAGAARAAETPPAPAKALKAIEDRLDLKSLGMIALEYGNRYSTVESWSRDMIEAIHGSKGDLFGLSDVAAAIELMLNRGPYTSEDIIYVKDIGLRLHITAHPIPVSKEEAHRIVKTGLVSYNYLTTPEVSARIADLGKDAQMVNAMARLEGAFRRFHDLEDDFHIVPDPEAKPDEEGKWDAPWFGIDRLTANVAPGGRFKKRTDVRPIGGISAPQAEQILTSFLAFDAAWRARDVDGINQGIRALSDAMPKLAAPGNYPSLEHRRLEVRYHDLDLTRKAWIVYIIAMFLSIFSLGTGFRWPRPVVLILLLGAIGLHAWAVGMRWNALGRIPVANMYEAVVSSTLVGAALAWFLELFTRARVYAMAAAFLGFFALALPELNVISSSIQTMMPILDDIMLRIHTVLIISSYAVITLAFAVANCYLFVSAHRDRSLMARCVLGAEVGIGAKVMLAVSAFKYDSLGITRPQGVLAGVWDFFFSDPITAGYGPFFVYLTFSALAGAVIASGLWGLVRPRGSENVFESAPSEPGEGGDVLKRFDLAHRVLLYISAIALFVGLVLGAVWADYSWGRPWGWDPKEVFALNTWLVYAILIHVPFVTRKRALWTSVLSVLGFAVMQFNWWVVNFYIVGLHSYA